MRDQPPDNNNPANPLMKVAALELDKDYISEKGEKKIRVNASLNFKKSNDLTGSALAKNGRKVNVSFGLIIKRASLHIVCRDDLGNKPEGFVSIQKVAFAAPLTIPDKVEEKHSTDRQKNRHGGLALKVAGRAGPESVGADVAATASASAKVGQTDRKKRKLSRRFELTSVSATHAGGEVHWEINPSSNQLDLVHGEYLSGSVFTNAIGNQMPACLIRRKDGGSVANLEIIGSVFVAMKDLIVSEIEFLDDDGVEVSTRQLLDENSQNVDFRELLEFKKIAKERVLRQIIRKHLIKQGLKIEGALVEICRAST